MRTIAVFVCLAVQLMLNAQVPAYVPISGLQSWYPFNGDASDESGNGNNGTVNGASLTTDRLGGGNAAYSFDGLTSFIDLSGNTSVVDAFTLSFWLHPSSATTGYLVDRDICAGANDWSVFWVDGEINLRYGLGGNDYFIQGVQPAIGTWHHVVAVRDPAVNELRLYLNGQSVSSISYPSGSFSNAAIPIYVGESNCNPGSSPNFTGDIDDIGIWNRALTQQEVQALFTGEALPLCVSATAVSMSGLNSSYETTDAAVSLVGTPSGGVFIGAGISGSSFDPAVAGVGTHTIIYTYVDGNGCVNSTGMCTGVTQGVGIGDEQNMPLGGVRVFPNPADGLFNLELELQGMVSLAVFDSRGRQVLSQTFMANGPKTLRVLDLSREAAGSYSFQVSTAQGSIQHLIVRD